MQTKKNSATWTLRIAAVLVCFVVITSALVSGVMARYTVGTSGTDSARVAAFVFDVNEGEAEKKLDLSAIKQPGDSAQYDFYVTNQKGGRICEVAQAYQISAESLGSLPLTVQLEKIDGDGTSIGKTLSDTFAAGTAQTVHYRLRVTWENETENSYVEDGISVVWLKFSSQQID